MMNEDEDEDEDYDNEYKNEEENLSNLSNASGQGSQDSQIANHVGDEFTQTLIHLLKKGPIGEATIEDQFNEFMGRERSKNRFH